MRRKPLYHFESGTSTGINKVPASNVVYVEDANGSTIQFRLLDNSTMTGSSTINDLLDDTTLYQIISGNHYLTLTANKTVAAGTYIYANTSAGAFTITLPASPTAQDEVIILDVSGDFETNNLIVGRNGTNIMGLAQDMYLDVNHKEYKFIFTGTDWRVSQ